ncbi:MAG: hypothetical protein HYZ49_20325 [Chloroflexi bacterium]|nr:hypothetical protein [Chloroflexota bacterium]
MTRITSDLRETGHRAQRGQGLVEYAIILVLVAVVVLIILAVLGPGIGNVFSNVVTNLQQPGGGGGGGGGNVITSLTATRTGGGHGNSVKVDITVSTSTTVTVTDSQSGGSQSLACNGSCSVTMGGVGDNAGTITVTASAGGTMSAGYPPKS